MILLYHGSNIAIEQIDLGRSKREKILDKAFTSMLILIRLWLWQNVLLDLGTKENRL